MSELTFDSLVEHLEDYYGYEVTKKDAYVVVTFPGEKYHITIYADQWDEYEAQTGKPYYLFHASSDRTDNRCSIYFWVDKSTHKISLVPANDFDYNCTSFNFHQSTREKCDPQSVDSIIRKFQKILNRY